VAALSDLNQNAFGIGVANLTDNPFNRGAAALSDLNQNAFGIGVAAFRELL
jgi:hypothetical protein